MQDLEHSPRVVERHCGGWLAYSAPQAALKIGVVAKTERAARERFVIAVDEWQTILASAKKAG